MVGPTNAALIAALASNSKWDLMLDRETFKGGFAAGLLVAVLDFALVAYIPSFPFSALQIARLLEYWPMIAILVVIVLTGFIANIIGANRTWSGLTVGIGIGTGLFAILVEMGIPLLGGPSS